MRENVRSAPERASTAVMTRLCSGQEGAGSREAITGSRTAWEKRAVVEAIRPTRARPASGQRAVSSAPATRSVLHRRGRAAISASAGASCRSYSSSRSSPEVSCAPAEAPAEVPRTRSASRRSTPASPRPARIPISQASPTMPPPPSTNALPMGEHSFASGTRSRRSHDTSRRSHWWNGGPAADPRPTAPAGPDGTGAVTPVWNPYSADCWSSSFFTRFSNMRTNSGRLAWATS